jgi:hypothetical protein
MVNKKINIVVILFLLFSSLIQWYFDVKLANTDGILEVYPLIIGTYSMYAIYFSCIQFIIQLKYENNTFFGINYVSKKLEELSVIKFSRTKYFFLLLVFYGGLPIIFNYGLIFIQIWMSVLFAIITLFIYILYKGVNLLFEVSDDKIILKRNYCLEKVIEEINDNLKRLDIKYSSIEYSKETEGNFYEREVESIIYIYLKSLKNKEEKEFLYNILLNKVCINKEFITESFYIRYFNRILEENINLIVIREEKEKNYISFSYPLLEIFANYDISDKLFEIILKILKNNKDIDPPLFLAFVFKIIDKYTYEKVKELLDVIIVLKRYNINSVNCIGVNPEELLLSELLYRLFLNGVESNKGEVNNLKEVNIKKIWSELFKLNLELLNLPDTVNFANIDLQKKEFNIRDNLYEKAKIEFNWMKN